jgi:gamma-glutamyltranspeptidase / glutathione hydrolase
LSRFPESNRIFLRDGKYYEPGDVFVQPELARTLERVARLGAKDFYEGETAQLLAKDMKEHGGLITLDDLKKYAAIERKPLTGAYRGYSIVTAPPPSSGGVGVLQMLGILEGTNYEKGGAGSASVVHYMTEAMRRYFADRSEHLGDPDFVKVPVTAMLDPKYIAKLRASIDPERATPSSEIHAGKFTGSESNETTHYSVADEAGNIALVTYTLNGGYGSKVTASGLGFLLNNEMDDFTAKPGSPNMFGLVQGEANSIQPEKRPLSAMTPTILTRDGKLFMVVGAPGGPRIISAVLQAILNVVDFGLNVQDAVDFPRFHHQWEPDRLTLEPGFKPDVIAGLKARGHEIDTASGNVSSSVEAIVYDQGWLEGGADPRSSGKAAGY